MQAVLRSSVHQRRRVGPIRPANAPLALAFLLFMVLSLGSAQSTYSTKVKSPTTEAPEVEPFGSAFVVIAISITMIAGYFVFDFALSKTAFRSKHGMQYHHKSKATPPAAKDQKARSIFSTSPDQETRTPLATAKSVQPCDSDKTSEALNH